MAKRSESSNKKTKKKENLVKNWQTLKKYDNESVKHIKKKYRANGASNVAYEKAKYQDCSMKYEHIFFLLFHQNITYLVGFHDVSIALEQPSKVSRKYSWLFKVSFVLSITSKSCKIVKWWALRPKLLYENQVIVIQIMIKSVIHYPFQ